jgi:hypothetical protein
VAPLPPDQQIRNSATDQLRNNIFVVLRRERHCRCVEGVFRIINIAHAQNGASPLVSCPDLYSVPRIRVPYRVPVPGPPAPPLALALRTLLRWRGILIQPAIFKFKGQSLTMAERGEHRLLKRKLLGVISYYLTLI